MQTTAKNPVFFSAALLLSVVTGACADPVRSDDLNWLQTMAFAAHQTSFTGTFVYQYGSHVETSRITHIADREGEHGRLESLDGPKREIIRNNDQMWCDLGDGKMKLEQRLSGREFPALLPEQITLLSKNYLVKPAEEVRLAGFHAHAMVFQPKDNMRYTHKMWADSVSGLLLKSEVLDEHGDVVEQYSFTQLSIGGDIDRKWIISREAVGDPGALNAQTTLNTKTLHDALPSHHFPRMAASAIASGWRVDALPDGFKKIAEVRRHLHGKEIPVIQMVFSDGLAGISVFIEQADRDADDHEGLSSQGVIQVYSKLDNDTLITVVGEVPPRTVMQIADSVRFGGNQ